MPVPLLAPAPLAPMGSLVTHDVTIVTTRKRAQARVMGVPPEEFGIERGARSIRDCNYCFHEVVTKTEAELIAEGFDAGQIRALRPHTGTTEIETLARDTVEEHFSATAGGASTNTAARLVRIWEVEKQFAYVTLFYYSKLLIWDKVLGLGSTDPLTGWALWAANLIISFYFAKRGFENVARIIKR